MKILFITEIFPYPLNSGGKIVTYQMLKMLSSQHDVHLLTLCAFPPATQEIKALTSMGITLKWSICNKRSISYKQSGLELLRAIFHAKPFFISLFQDHNFAQIVTQTLHEQSFDAIHIDHLSMAQYLPQNTNAVRILHEHNIEHLLYKDLSNNSTLQLKERIFYFYNWISLLFYERLAVKWFDIILVLSQRDKKILESEGISASKIFYIPPSSEIITRTQKPKRKGTRLLFIGNLWWKPNEVALNWFIAHVIPKLLSHNPDVTLTVIGEESMNWQKKIQSNLPIICFEKPKMLIPFFLNSDIFIAPFTIGEGVRIKILTAFANHIPVVSSRIGMRGLNVRPSREFLEANDAQQFAKQINTLLTQPKTAYRISASAKEYVKKYHNFEHIQKTLLSIYEKTNR